MNFIKRIIDAGFIEQNQKAMFENGIKGVPKWWVDYPFDSNWYGLTMYHPDAYFECGKFAVKISLNGMTMGNPRNKNDVDMILNKSAKYIGVFEDGKCIYQTFNGVAPNEEIMELITGKLQPNE